ncbi:hypothetical protein CICLE_v100067941mg, partial [Citrus x clementina]
GRIVEIYGRKASGETTLALHVIKEAQKLGDFGFLYFENALDHCLAEAMGIDIENLLIVQPDSTENLLSVVDTLTKSGSIDVIVVDSVAPLIPKCEIGVPINGMYSDAQSRIMTQTPRKIHIFVVPVRFSAKSSHGLGCMDEVFSGGIAVKFYAALRLRMVRTKLFKIGDKVNVLVVVNTGSMIRL